MRAVDIIMKKRDGGTLTAGEIQFLVSGLVSGGIPQYQAAAWAMAVFFRGMTSEETAALTTAMLDSGDRINLDDIDASVPVVDKHSTGGVGDKTSLVLAPLAASLGIVDPMMSGRALGHTGGTLDKLEAIPGYRTALSTDEFKAILKRRGFAMTGQSKEIVPADRLLYALRDVTATVESIPLITASILSKKKAEGARALVLDVKYGSGAFMKDPADGEKLARSLVDTGAAMGMKITALITNMNEPLGNKVGNFLEVEECYDCLTGKGPDDLMDVTLELGGRMALLAGKAKTHEEAAAICAEALRSVRPRELFLQNIQDQGGDPDQFLKLIGNYRSQYSDTVYAARDGFISHIDAFKVGHAGVLLGVGRNRTEDPVSPVAGIEFHRKRGSAVNSGDPVMTVWGKDEESLRAAMPRLAEAVEYTDTAPAAEQMVLKEISAI